MAYFSLAVCCTYKAARWQFIIFYFVRKKKFGKERHTHTHTSGEVLLVTTIQWIREPTDAKVSTMQHKNPPDEWNDDGFEWQIHCVKWKWIFMFAFFGKCFPTKNRRTFERMCADECALHSGCSPLSVGNLSPIFRWDVPSRLKLLRTHTLRHTRNANSSYGFSLTRRSSFIHHAFSYRILVSAYFFLLNLLANVRTARNTRNCENCRCFN